MRLYEESIRAFSGMTQGARSLSVGRRTAKWPDADPSDIILRSEMAYELGGGTKEALSALTLTEDPALVPRDEILLLGKDLPEIKADCAYARIAVVRVKKDSLGSGDRMYRNIRKIEYVRYHVHPAGYMIRVSGANSREPVRIGSAALRRGLGFREAGGAYLAEYHKNPLIEAVKLIFVTEPEFDYRELKGLIRKNDAITAAIDHILKDVKMDCSSCSDKAICDEIDGLRELHNGMER